MPETDWTPKSREDWVNLFADGTRKAINDDREAEAKAKAEAAKTGEGNGETGDKTDPKPTLAQRILGSL